jgi:hypothetical protein
MPIARALRGVAQRLQARTQVRAVDGVTFDAVTIGAIS